MNTSVIVSAAPAGGEGRKSITRRLRTTFTVYAEANDDRVLAEPVSIALQRLLCDPAVRAGAGDSGQERSFIVEHHDGLGGIASTHVVVRQDWVNDYRINGVPELVT